MNDVQKSILTAGVVLSAVAASIVGATMRSNRDLGQADQATLESASMRGLLASKDNQVDVPASDYFYELSDKVKKEFVEPVADDQKLASGAVRGMIGSLSDPKSTFMAKDEFQAYLKARQGQYGGIGVDVALEFADELAKKATANKPGTTKAPADSSETTTEEALADGLQIPRVVIVDVVPGGPADKAGVRPGDIVYEVDQHWVANAEEVAAFRMKQQEFISKKLDRQTYFKLRNDIRKKTERALMPIKVRERLTVGGEGAINVTWLRDGKKIETKLQKAKTTAPAFRANGDTVFMPLNGKSAEELRQAISGKPQITIDLRHNVNGDYDVMRKALAVLAPTGNYGSIVTDKKDVAQKLEVTQGNASPPKLTVLVDQTTSGPAAILALALEKKAGAKLSSSVLGSDRTVRQVITLPDGSGYTLVTGSYSAAGGKK